ncbi:MAG: ABC transporter substrate-binding protein [Dermatophilaceae bacterium]
MTGDHGGTAASSRPTRHRALRLVVALLAVLTLAVATGCSAGGPGAGTTTGGSLRLGYFANLTHASAVIGVKDGHFARALGSTTLQTQVFNAGPAATEALLAGALDAAYLGPNPAINAYAKSNGEAIRIVAGATSGGASFVVRPGITVADLRGKTFASPQLGGTQDVALRAWLKARGLNAPVTGTGDVTVAPQDNAQTLALFKAGTIDGAWLPEPWATRLRTEAGGQTLVDERDLWPQGQFVTTHLVVSTRFLTQHPDQVRALVSGAIAADAAIAADPAGARARVGAAIKDLTGADLPASELADAWGHLAPTLDPMAATLGASARAATSVGISRTTPDLSGIYDLRILNDLLRAAGKPPVSAAGLGKE